MGRPPPVLTGTPIGVVQGNILVVSVVRALLCWSMMHAMMHADPNKNMMHADPNKNKT